MIGKKSFIKMFGIRIVFKICVVKFVVKIVIIKSELIVGKNCVIVNLIKIVEKMMGKILLFI